MPMPATAARQPVLAEGVSSVWHGLAPLSWSSCPGEDALDVLGM